MGLEYITTRVLQNSSGKITGKIKIMKLKEEPDANVDYTCPKCFHNDKMKVVWQKPLKFRCRNCNFLIKISSLKSEIKKLRKKL